METKREYKTDGQLRVKANDMAKVMHIRRDAGSSEDYERPATKWEANELENLFYGVLLGLNYGEAIRNETDPYSSILYPLFNTVEFMAMMVFTDDPDLAGDERLQTYTGFYLPLHEALRTWNEW